MTTTVAAPPALDVCHRCDEQPVFDHGILCAHCRAVLDDDAERDQ